ncbi:ninja-family protein AFP3-like [Solanum verrucosum]|uniref:ninja-family protein AFP3-like n=1 Tax=Solanum verrucosum TaxID=315347 RepID=UPI0020D19258|nr:ninja-family protein AFP3-like [Solanum verrucosum]
MEKADENTVTSNVENENVELNGGSQGSVASSVAEVETQQPPIQDKNIKFNHMTFVSTRGEGPNGKKTEGVLYSCKKKDEVGIVCLCHGDLLNAAEFVEHTGGGYVEHHINHIFIDGK